jgi:hypothetical protein
MAVKYFCDGCDRETSTKKIGVSVQKAPDTPSPTLQQLQQGVLAQGNYLSMNSYYDLCAACEAGLRNWANPKSWVRPKLPEPRLSIDAAGALVRMVGGD